MWIVHKLSIDTAPSEYIHLFFIGVCHVLQVPRLSQGRVLLFGGKGVTCPYCGRHFILKGRKTRRVEEVIQVLQHGRYAPPADGLGTPPR